MDLRNIAILGAGGNVGCAIINELLNEKSNFNITAITRKTSTYKAPSTSNIISKTVDYTSLSSLIEAFTGQDAIVDCLTGGAAQYDTSTRIIDAAVTAGVKFFFANEFVGYIEREQYQRLPESFVGAKVRNRAYLQQLSEAGKIAWTSLNGGPFFDMWLMKGPAGFDIPNRKVRIYGTGNNPLCWTPLPTIAVAAGNMLRNPDAVKNQPVYICPFVELSQNTILACVEKVLDAKFGVEYVDVERINTNARIALQKGEAGRAMKGLAVSNQFYEGDSGNDFRHLVRNELVGVEMMSLEDAVRDAIKQYGDNHAVVEGMFRVEACEV